MLSTLSFMQRPVLFEEENFGDQPLRYSTPIHGCTCCRLIGHPARLHGDGVIFNPRSAPAPTHLCDQSVFGAAPLKPLRRQSRHPTCPMHLSIITRLRVLDRRPILPILRGTQFRTERLPLSLRYETRHVDSPLLRSCVTLSRVL